MRDGESEGRETVRDRERLMYRKRESERERVRDERWRDGGERDSQRDGERQIN